ncbi:MAG: hypothetical protein H7Z41_16285 [Cytophagales bacterium]|nr:hypothetical protein [Armatimonadota bacterium]
MPFRRIGFEAPDNLPEMLALLNQGGTGMLRLSVVDETGAVYGYLSETAGITSDKAGADGVVEILNGTLDDGKVVYRAESGADALSFLYGAFLGMFHAKPLDVIHDAVTLPYEIPPA